MTRTLPGATFDSESLQADVMRFMAIIGFCLVAVFALVRHNGAEPIPPKAAEAAKPVPRSTERTIEAVTPTPVDAAVPRPVKVVPPRLPKPVVHRRASSPSKPAPAERPAPAQSPANPDAESKPLSEPPSSEAPGLTLSFASDRDFLRLLGAGTIELFVIAPGSAHQTLKLDPQQRFVTSSAPGRVYELMPETIPAPIVAALNQQHADAAIVTWSVRLPEPLERAIARERDLHQNGTLLIDRHARVRHVPAA